MLPSVKSANGLNAARQILSRASFFKTARFSAGYICFYYWGFPLAKKSSSAEKRHRQSEERRMRNKAVKSAVRTSVKKFIVLARKKDLPASEAALKEMVKKIDTASRKGIIKKNAAARKKSRMQRYFNTIQAAQ
jgi:small subunit ribosomal protein S20